MSAVIFCSDGGGRLSFLLFPLLLRFLCVDERRNLSGRPKVKARERTRGEASVFLSSSSSSSSFLVVVSCASSREFAPAATTSGRPNDRQTTPSAGPKATRLVSRRLPLKQAAAPEGKTSTRRHRLRRRRQQDDNSPNSRNSLGVWCLCFMVAPDS